jgi:hypothetical protein
MLFRPANFTLILTALVVLSSTVRLPAQSTDLSTKAQALKDQYDRANPSDKKEIGESLIDTQLALANTLETQHDFSGAQKILSQALLTASAIKSDKSKTVTAKLTSVSLRKTHAAKIDSLRNSLLTKPNDPDLTRQLVDLLVLEFDDYKNAQEAATGQDDAKFKSALQLASKPPGDLTPSETLDLSLWYIDSSKRNTGTIKAAAQLRAAILLKQLLDRSDLDPNLKAKAQPLFEALPAEAKNADPASPNGPDAALIGLSANSIAQWLKNVPKDVSERKPGEQNYQRFQRVRDYIRKTFANEYNKPIRIRGASTDRVNFRKGDNGWEAEISLEIETTSSPIKLRSTTRVSLTEAQMKKLSDIARPTVEIEGKWTGLYIYSSNSDGDNVTYSVQLQDARLISFK